MNENQRCRRPNKTGSDHPLPVLPDCGRREGSGLLGVDLPVETGNFAGSGFFVEHPFFGRFIDGGLGRVEQLNGISRILRHGEAHILDDILYPSLNRFVAQAPTLILAGALQC